MSDLTWSKIDEFNRLTQSKVCSIEDKNSQSKRSNQIASAALNVLSLQEIAQVQLQSDEHVTYQEYAGETPWSRGWSATWPKSSTEIKIDTDDIFKVVSERLSKHELNYTFNHLSLLTTTNDTFRVTKDHEANSCILLVNANIDGCLITLKNGLQMRRMHLTVGQGIIYKPQRGQEGIFTGMSTDVPLKFLLFDHLTTRRYQNGKLSVQSRLLL